MDRQSALDLLIRVQARLQPLGLARMAMFGSTAPGEMSGSSDIDLAVALDERAKIDLFRFAAISEQLSHL